MIFPILHLPSGDISLFDSDFDEGEFLRMKDNTDINSATEAWFTMLTAFINQYIAGYDEGAADAWDKMEDWGEDE